MASIRQYLLLLHLSLSTIPQRRPAALTILVATACVVGVLLSMLSATAGVVDAFRTATDPHIAVVLPDKDLFDDSDSLPRDVIGTIINAPGIARGPDGKVLAEAEILMFSPPVRRIASGGFLRIRGMGARGAAIRPGFRIVAGRMFGSGRQELIVGAGTQRAFGLNIGDNVRLRQGSWPIVGVFTADGVNANELAGDVETLAAMLHFSGYGSVQARLETPAKLPEFRQWLTTNPALAVTAETQQSYFNRIVAGQSDYFTAIAYLTGAIMAIGALFGSINIFYGIVSARAREMAILRAIGYGALPVAASVVFEALLLSLLGALVGAGVAWLLFGGREFMVDQNIYRLLFAPRVVLIGIGWALALALAGSLLPAIRAGRLRVIQALRAT
ncbi:MAG TPA: FtsX-like permease family protein [Steroidobacteraceae bacterium]|nr:FtsX-like permease family protein [Steroidobacteraceae bacterium]